MEANIRDVLTEFWHFSNERYFDGKLDVPFIVVESISPHSNTSTRILPNDTIVLSVAECVVSGRAKRVVRGWPSPGLVRFVKDAVLHEQIHVFQKQVSRKCDPGHRGHGQHFCRHCNRIGKLLGLSEVIPKKYGEKDKNRHECVHWPHNVRQPPGFYCGDVVEYWSGPSRLSVTDL